jgi:hypothetical protein
VSSYIFSLLHPDPEIQKWTEMLDWEQNWTMIESHHAAIVQSARSLDSMANRKLSAGFPLTGEDRYLLYRAYHAAFKTCKAKGAMQEKARTYGERHGMRGNLPTGAAEFA